MAAQLEFPHTIGPFTMQPCRVHNAINAFYRHHQFPKPDPTSNENSMAGIDPYAAGFPEGEILFCQLSPLHRITLDDETKAAANIPQASEYFAWCYPVVDNGIALQGTSGEALFLQYGGYVYFNTSKDAIGTNGIAPAALGTLGLMFGRPQSLEQTVADTLTKQGRFQEITLKPLSDKGATHFAWIRPGEFADSTASPDGSFAYKFRNSEAKYFPVVNKPVFTKELLGEELEESESWGVVRIAKPTIERLLIFDHAKSFAENLEGSAAKDLFVSVSDNDVRVSRIANSGDMTYQQWQQSSERTGLIEPWIFTVSAEGTRQIEANDLVELDPF